MKYEFKNLQTGQPCCRGNDIKLLCNACVAQAIAAHERAGRAAPSAPAPTVAAARPAAVPTIEVAPEVPSLVAAVNARRAGQTTYNLDAPVFGNGVRPYPVTVAAAHEESPDPPSLTDAVNRRRSR